MAEAASEQRNRTAFATSSGAAIFPRGVMPVIAAANLGSACIHSAIGGVSTQPGQTAVMRTPLEAYCRAALLVRRPNAFCYGSLAVSPA